MGASQEDSDARHPPPGGTDRRGATPPGPPRTIECGNHKSATKDGPKLLSIVGKEVEKVWQLTLPISALQHLPGAVLGPVGIVSQDSIDAFGHRLPKDRPIHDQSFSFGSGQLLNNRVIKDELTPCRYGFALSQDCGPARELPCRANPALKIRLQVGLPTRPPQGRVGSPELHHDLTLVSLRTTFGDSPCPSIFSEISETVTDLTNAIIRCSDYDPASFPSHYSHLLSPAKVEPDNVPLAAGRS